ncbi:hypothetical protein AB0F64_36055 [Streptomyces sp. NPDC026294]|uniref:hypothetical protein n=1 Tax=Streptomyces sp. NPDC026294 TaxID=3155362 RepID=UPI0033E6D376
MDNAEADMKRRNGNPMNPTGKKCRTAQIASMLAITLCCGVAAWGIWTLGRWAVDSVRDFFTVPDRRTALPAGNMGDLRHVSKRQIESASTVEEVKELLREELPTSRNFITPDFWDGSIGRYSSIGHTCISATPCERAGYALIHQPDSTRFKSRDGKDVEDSDSEAMQDAIIRTMKITLGSSFWQAHSQLALGITVHSDWGGAAEYNLEYSRDQVRKLQKNLNRLSSDDLSTKYSE